MKPSVALQIGLARAAVAEHPTRYGMVGGLRELREAIDHLADALEAHEEHHRLMAETGPR